MNPWIISILASIIGSVIYYLLYKIAVKLFGRSEYNKRVKEANHQLVAVLRNLISEGAIPSNQIIKALITSYSRSYSIKISDMYSVIDVKEELIKELFETSFIDVDRKLELSRALFDDSNVEYEKVQESSEHYVSKDTYIPEQKKEVGSIAPLIQFLIMFISIGFTVFIYIAILLRNFGSNLQIKDILLPLIPLYIILIAFFLFLNAAKSNREREKITLKHDNK
ncbi:hypothetical protein [Oceanobacillus jeddahense]|uniref:hypothetical protein n=1 Tax=Oceanobacillus jeddahense TaxID=1462527 RepID=UPI000694E7E5|nr:hypothetical protein [Oceanobacillus jeddahense]